MNRIIALALLFVAALAIDPTRVEAAAGHENSCSVVNVNYGVGVMTIICATGSINMAILTGNSIAGTCPTVDMDTMKIMTSLALAARVSGLFLTIWYTDTCGAGLAPTTRAIQSIEVKGN
jgi:hypothetical protein